MKDIRIKRCLASLIDNSIICIIFATYFVIISVLMVMLFTESNTLFLIGPKPMLAVNQRMFWSFLFIQYVPLMLCSYWLISKSKGSRTIGYRLFGLQMRNSNGTGIPKRKSFLFNFSFWIALVLFISRLKVLINHDYSDFMKDNDLLVGFKELKEMPFIVLGSLILVVLMFNIVSILVSKNGKRSFIDKIQKTEVISIK